jgi:lysophospholipase L1-like esterase
MTRRIAMMLLVWSLLFFHIQAFSQEQKGYLALGDSLALGFDPLLPMGDLKNYHGYPEVVATALDEKLVNASCFGESAQHFISLSALDMGCQEWRAKRRPLFVSYNGTQLDYAVQYLKSHWKTSLVTINIGANDLALFAVSAGAACQGEFDVVACITNKLQTDFLPAYATNLTTILSRIRIEAGYTGPIVAVSSYALNYQDPLQVGGFAALNFVLSQVFGGNVADAFSAFGAAAATAGGDLCNTGLLIKLPNGTCDTHPSREGQALIADLVLAQLD